MSSRNNSSCSIIISCRSTSNISGSRCCCCQNVSSSIDGACSRGISIALCYSHCPLVFTLLFAQLGRRGIAPLRVHTNGSLLTLFLYLLHVLWCMCSFCIVLPLNYCSQLFPCKHHFHMYAYRISHHTQPSAQHGMLFAETSCESGANVAAAFETLLQGTFPARHVTSSSSYCMTSCSDPGPLCWRLHSCA